MSTSIHLEIYTFYELYFKMNCVEHLKNQDDSYN